MIDRLAAVVALIAALAPGRAGAAPAIPPEFAVCVVTVDAGGRARLDSYWNDVADAKMRRREIVADGWTTERPLPGEVTEFDREYEYPPTSLVKVFIDSTILNEHSCRPAPIAQSVDGDGAAGQVDEFRARRAN